MKLKQRQEFVVVGFTRGKGRRSSSIGALVLRLSNLEKPFWPDEGITKGDLLFAPVLTLRQSLGVALRSLG